MLPTFVARHSEGLLDPLQIVCKLIGGSLLLSLSKDTGYDSLAKILQLQFVEGGVVKRPSAGPLNLHPLWLWCWNFKWTSDNFFHKTWKCSGTVVHDGLQPLSLHFCKLWWTNCKKFKTAWRRLVWRFREIFNASMWHGRNHDAPLPKLHPLWRYYISVQY